MGLIQLASDEFARADNVDLGADWAVTSGLNSLQIVGNAVRAGGGSSVRQEQNTSVSWPNDQWCEVTYKTVSAGSNYSGVLVRCSPSAETNYLALFNRFANQAFIYKIVATSYTELASAAAHCVAGDTWRIEARGSRLSVFKNNELVMSATDTEIASGQPGFRIYNNTGLADVEIESWRGGIFSKSQGTGRRRRGR
jgi:hypothetical protein